jgi:hypothetical protein
MLSKHLISISRYLGALIVLVGLVGQTAPAQVQGPIDPA